MQKILTRQFFEKPTLKVAQKLLGKVLVIGNTSGRINEVEAYIGQNDPACHACRGMTDRNKPMFGEPGHLYVYFCYGMYDCANIVTEKKGFPAAVLLRSVEPVKGVKIMEKRRGPKYSGLLRSRKNNLANGPGKLCIALGMAKKSHNEMDLCNGGKCFVYDDGFVPKKIKTSPRIGIKVGLNKKWRFYY